MEKLTLSTRKVTILSYVSEWTLVRCARIKGRKSRVGISVTIDFIENLYTTKKFTNLISNDIRCAHFFCKINDKRDSVHRFTIGVPYGCPDSENFTMSYSLDFKSARSIDALPVSS